MEPVTIVTIAVGFIGGFHLINNIGKVLARGKGATTATTGARSDWYCFFRMRDLLGADWKPCEEREQARKNLTDAKRDGKRRQQANRPRMYA